MKGQQLDWGQVGLPDPIVVDDKILGSASDAVVVLEETQTSAGDHQLLHQLHGREVGGSVLASVSLGQRKDHLRRPVCVKDEIKMVTTEYQSFLYTHIIYRWLL